MRVVVLCQRGEQGEAHLAHTTHKWLLFHLYTLVLQKICGLAKNFHTLSALEGPILAHHALVLMGVGQVRDIMAAGAALVPSFAPHL